MTGRKYNLSVSYAVDAVSAFVWIVVCRFMVKRPDCWDKILSLIARLKKKIRPKEILEKPYAFKEITEMFGLSLWHRRDNALIITKPSEHKMKRGV